MSNQEKSKYLVEYFGGRWHEWVAAEVIDFIVYQRCSCGKLFRYRGQLDDHAKKKNPDLYTPDGFFWIIDELERIGKWKEFRKRHGFPELNVRCIPYNYDENYIDATLFNYLTFPDRVIEFLEGLK